MRMFLSLIAALFLSVSPALAGGDWYEWDDGWGYRHHWRDGYRVYYGPPLFVPRAYAVPYAYPYYSDYDDYAVGDCEVERKWRHGRLVSEEVDCDD